MIQDFPALLLNIHSHPTFAFNIVGQHVKRENIMGS